MASIAWLHLSDWHQRVDDDFDRRVIRDGLISDVRNRAEISPDLAKIDLIIFSGDVACSGKAEEYAAAADLLFAPLLQETRLDHERLFIVPGNHDIDYHQFRYLPQELTKPLESEEQVQDWLSEKNRHYALEPFQAFARFVSDYTHQPQPSYATTRLLEPGGELAGKQIALFGFNSALMCGRSRDSAGHNDASGSDYGKLVVGEVQIYDALCQFDTYDLAIAVLHHPFSWLSEFDANHVEERLREKCHFILCGHQHKPSVKVEAGTMGRNVIIPVGAAYGTRLTADPRYINAYNFVCFDFATFQGTVYLRRWSDSRNSFIEDVGSYPEGQFHFQLSALEDDLPSSTVVLSLPELSSASKDTYATLFLLAHEYSIAAIQAAQLAYSPFRKGHMRSVQCTESIQHLQEMRHYVQKLSHLLITTSPLPTIFIKDLQRFIRNSHNISRWGEELIAAIKTFRGSRYILPGEQVEALRSEIEDRFAQILQTLAQLNIPVRG